MKISSATLVALRPEPVTMDPEWSHASLTAILAEPTTRAGSRRRAHSRVALVSLAFAATSTLGAGVAVAAGDLTFHSFTEVFSYWKSVDGHQGVDPARAQRMATAPGPDDAVFSVLATGSDYTCRTAVVESAESAEDPLPSSFTPVTDNFCASTPLGADFGGADVSFQGQTAGYIVSAGSAARAEVHTPDGREYPALLVDGDFWGWFPTDAHPTLVGYALDGTVIGRVELGKGTGSPDQPQ
ncbi:hypothetical protein [Nocardioides sediminis]|uniref:hypothetical protein n=1 Tax=Nocardioides sediminis TaxID=433648 RepID=UPI00131EEC00|nr:hypothetical protein [Nocardioides sediminis]